LDHPHAVTTAEQIAMHRLAADLAGQGWGHAEQFISGSRLAELSDTVKALWEQGQFQPAGVGRGVSSRLNSGVRGDYTLWLEECTAPAVSGFVRHELEALRRVLNAVTYLGLFEFEGQLAVYPPGAGYARHVDQFRDAGERLVSVVFYLNEVWHAGDGGELCLYPSGQAQERSIVISPVPGTLVVFLSAGMSHEVRPAARPRFSLSGWFRRRAA
jgi:SM-20-related protein